jgi:preprotein translocase subunit SecA
MAIAAKIKELNQKGQPVLVGTVSIEKNELLSDYLKKEGVKHQMLNAKPQFAEREGEIVSAAGKKGAVTIATNMAGRGVDIKLGGPLGTNEEYEEIRSLGGLFVLGTERHEARRIDNQLRGRSGRQGDPGETQFFVSLEDDLMKVFATDTVKNMMGRFGIPEDQPIESSLITRGLENAQTKIEGFHFDARKNVLEYDDVLSFQRKTVYDRRRKILLGADEEVMEQFDGMYQKATDDEKKAIDERKARIQPAEYVKIIRQVLLQAIDLFWVDHLELMDYSRSSVNLRAYGQRDPLVEYKREGLRLYKEMGDATDAEVIRLLSHLEIQG